MSRRRSPSKARRQPRLPRFVLDECVRSFALRDALRADGLRADLSVELYGEEIPDEELFPRVRADGALFLTKDHAIARQPARQAALVEQRIGAVFLAHEEMTKDQMIASVRAAYGRLERFTARYRPPFIVRITPTGHLDRVFAPVRAR